MSGCYGAKKAYLAVSSATKPVVEKPSSYLSDSFRRLDFSHLRTKELEIGSSPQCATSADPGAYTTLLLAAMMMRFMVPSPRFSLNTSSSMSRILT